MKFELSRPITAHGAEVSSLEIAEPFGKDVRECGLPYILAAQGVLVDSAAVARYIERLAKIPLSSVDQLSAADFDGIAMAVVNFFKKSVDQATA